MIARPVKPKHNIETLGQIADPYEQAREADAYRAYALDLADRALAIRNKALRRARDAGDGPAEVARRYGRSLNTVKVILGPAGYGDAVPDAPKRNGRKG